MVRPAFDLNISKVLFTSTTEVSKSSTFETTSDSSTNSWNLTLQAGDGFMAERKSGEIGNIPAGSSLTVHVSNPGTPEDNSGVSFNQISAMLVKSDGEDTGTVVAYGKIADNVPENGSIPVMIPDTGVTDGNYQLKVFAERVYSSAGTELTDYATNMADIPIRVGIAEYTYNTPSANTTNGITASVSYNKPSPQVSGNEITATVTLSGVANADGTHTIGLSSNKVSILAAQDTTCHVNTGEAVNKTMSFTFTLGEEDVDDITLTNSYVQDASMECTVSFDSCGGSSITPITCQVNDFINTSDKIPVKEGYIFDGWYKDAECTRRWRDEIDTVTESRTLYAGYSQIQDGLWVAKVDVHTYTGSAIKPEISVYYGERKLKQNRDYKLSYKNNVNVYTGTNEKKKSCIVVKGIGIYKLSGTTTIPFTIEPKSLSDREIIMDDLYRNTTGKEQKLIPIIRYGKKKLKYNKQEAKSSYTVAYSGGDYKSAGEYTITVTGKRNYTGSRTCKLTLTDKKLLSKTAVKITKNMEYKSGAPVVPTTLALKMGKDILQENTDYTVSYQDNTEIGTATAILTGMGEYAGVKKVTYQITGKQLGRVTVNGIHSMNYTGSPVELACSLNDHGSTLTAGADYTVSYRNNIDAGKGVIILTGKGKYTGTVKKTFRIIPYDLKENKEQYFEPDTSNISVSLKGRKATPRVTMKFRGVIMEEYDDYTLTYKNNQYVNSSTEPAKAPTIMIKGKGNFKGSLTKIFVIKP